MSTQCFVSDADYRLHFVGERQPPSAEPTVAVYGGEERRVAKIPRRGIPDRRWESGVGRRFRMTDRRRASVKPKADRRT